MSFLTLLIHMTTVNNIMQMDGVNNDVAAEAKEQINVDECVLVYGHSIGETKSHKNCIFCVLVIA